jgi:predicted transposase YdaD
MSKPYDAGTKFLIEHYLADWLELSERRSTNPTAVIDADLSTVTAAADKVLRVEDPVPWLLHLELQSGRDDELSSRVQWYNALLEYRHKLRVHSLVVLLRKEADASNLTGVFQSAFAGEPPYRTFRFQVARVWQLPVESLLHAGLGLLPLAPLSDDAAGHLPEVVAQINQRIEAEATDRQTKGTLWTATDILMGLRYERKLIDHILQKVFAMKESVTYQAIVEEGEVKGIRETLLLLGGKKFGPPDKSVIAALAKIDNIAKLKAMTERILDVENWQELITE